MNPEMVCPPLFVPCVPRTRGDEPFQSSTRHNSGKRSPHTRGIIAVPVADESPSRRVVGIAVELDHEPPVYPYQI
jgi:hypothetical protein